MDQFDKQESRFLALVVRYVTWWSLFCSSLALSLSRPPPAEGITFHGERVFTSRSSWLFWSASERELE